MRRLKLVFKSTPNEEEKGIDLVSIRVFSSGFLRMHCMFITASVILASGLCGRYITDNEKIDYTFFQTRQWF